MCSNVDEAAWYNNTFVGTGAGSSRVVWFKNTSTSITFKNNIVRGHTDSFRLLAIDSGTNGEVTTGGNCFWDASGIGGEPSFTNNDIDYATLALWQGAGFDLNSVEADPKLNSDYKLESNSPCLGIGRYNEEFPLGRNRYNKFGHRRLP